MTTLPTLATAADLAVQPTAEEVETTACHMAKEYREATAEIGRLILAIQAQTDRLREAFRHGEDFYSPFDIRFDYNGSRESADRADRIFTEMKRRAWQVLIDRLGIRNVMSVAKKKEFDEQLKSGDLPEINEDAIVSIILGLVGQAQDFATDAAKEVFDILRPRGGWGGQYKTNDSFRVGRKVILPFRVERRYGGGFRPNYHREQELVAIDGVFHLLDGKGVMREHRGPLIKAIEASTTGRGETEYFRFKCYKNCNLHLEMRRLDLVKQLNLLAAGEYVLGADTGDQP